MHRHDADTATGIQRRLHTSVIFFIIYFSKRRNNFKVRTTFTSLRLHKNKSCFEFILRSHQHSDLCHMTSVKCVASARRTSDDVSRVLARGCGIEQQQCGTPALILNDSF